MPIRKLKSGKYKIVNVKGTSPSLAAAKTRLQAIKASQASKKKGS